MMVVAAGVGIASEHFPEQATSTLLALAAFNTLDRVDRKIR